MTSVATERPLRVLVLSPVHPFPPTGGWSTVIYNDIKYLAGRGHQVTVLALVSERSADARDMANIAPTEYFFKAKPPQWRQVLGNLGRRLPYTITRQHDEGLLARASEFVRSRSVDVVLVEDVVLGRYSALLKRVAPVATYLRGHNIFTAVIRRYYESQRNPLLRFLGWRQFVKFGRYEASVMDTFDCVSQISPVDAQTLAQMNPRVKSRVLYSGVDLDYFAMAPARERDSDTIVHVGTLDPITKLPAMMWFYEKVLPRIRQRRPRARLELAGYTPECALHRADPSDVVVHGVVPDVRPYLAKGAAFVAAQFVGSGIRIKILNAMATGNAVVSTRIACEGLPVTHGQDIFIADDEQSFADDVASLLEDSALRERIGQQARRLIERQFGWPRIAEQLEKDLREAIRRNAAGGQATPSSPGCIRCT